MPGSVIGYDVMVFVGLQRFLHHRQREEIRSALFDQYGVKISGCTVHVADEGVDTGPILLQRAVEVLEGDTEETLSARILEQEHQIYWRAIDLMLASINQSPVATGDWPLATAD